MNNKSIKLELVIGLIIMLIIFAITPMVFGYKTSTTNRNLMYEHYTLNRYSKHYFPKIYSTEKHILYIQYKDVISEFLSEFKNTLESSLIEAEHEGQSSPITTDSPIDSPWPMHGHDVRHTGRSSYSTVETWDEKWIFITSGPTSSPSIDKDGIIYVGSYDFYAVHSNGTLKWMYNTGGVIESCCPAIDENGIIYIGIAHAVYGNYLYAIYPNGTLKWKYYTGDSVTSSPAIGEDGCIYFGDWTGNFHAVYPNGTRKWMYKTGDVITSSPAIGEDGTIYIGSHDDNVYALYPDNGTLKWIFNTGSWVHGIPTIGTDGTVYIGSDNGYLYAFYPNNGTIKWMLNIGCTWANPALDEDGTIYVGVWEKTFYAIYPNGTIKWSFSPGAKIWGSSPALSDDGTLYFGTCDLEWTGGVEIIALYTDGTVKWRKSLDTVFSSPAIGEDGTVYLGASGINEGYLHAFGSLDPNAPSAPIIDGPTWGRIKKTYKFTFGSTSPLGRDVYYYIDWGDHTGTNWAGPYASGEEAVITHSYTWPINRNYTIKAQAKDTENLWGPCSTFEIKISKSRNRVSDDSLFLRFLERFPLLQK